MKINNSTIINNFEWILNNQIAMDIIKLLGFQEQLYDASKEIRKIGKLDIDNITIEYITTHKKLILIKYLGIFDLFYELNLLQKNQNTYLPNLYALILISTNK